jgi:hypothetical protein
MGLDELVTRLKEAFGAELRAVVLYGSAAAGEHIAARSDYNVLVLVDSLSTERLRAASAVTQAWIKGGNPAPLTLTTGEWRASADIFPMEYADILERHRILHGDAPMAGMRVLPGDLRLQLEQQAMGKVLQLRQGAMAAGNDAGAQAALLAASLSAVMIVFRGVSRLHGRVPPPAYDALAREIGELAQFDPEPFVRVVRHVRREQELQGSGATLVLGGYLAGMEQLVRHVNAYVPRPA